MSTRVKLCLILFSICCFHFADAQPVFQNKTQLYKKNIPTRSVQPGGIADIDGDLVDDLILLDKGIWMKTVLSNGKNFGLTLMDSLKIAQNSEVTLAAGDINNDGIPEFITSGEYSLINVSSYKTNKISKRAFQSGIYAQGSNTIDINNDGWLDYFICNDDGPNRIYLNDKFGNLILTQVIDFMFGDPTDGSGNYGSVWTDVNGDFLPDLCISKCRAGVDIPTDPRRINRLYINNGNGTFTEKGAAFGLNSGEQSWVTTFGDIDNDGDQDAFLANHYAPHILYENIDNQYFRQISMPTQLQSFGFQAVMADFDNDGWLDIILAGAEGATLLHNKGNFQFDIIKGIIGPNMARSLTIGDLNDDGFLDIHAHIAEPINLPGVKDDELWLNTPNQNHYIKLNLEGTVSNRSAIGSHVTMYTNGQKQIRYLKGGESYGIFNSFQNHVGVGQNTMVDSVIIRWPSGLFQKFTNLAVDKTYLVKEASCISQQLELYPEEIIFKSEPLTLQVPQGMINYLWNNGSSSSNLTVTNPGKYFVRMTDNTGCQHISKPINVITGCFDPGKKIINEQAEVKICVGDKIEIPAIKSAEYNWSNGATTQSIYVDKTTSLSIMARDFCGNEMRDTISVKAIELTLNVKGDTIQKGDKAILVADNPQTLWYTSQNLNTAIHQGPSYTTPILDTTTTYFARFSSIIDSKKSFLGEKTFPVADLYGANSIAGGLVFNIEKPCILRSVEVNTDTKGKRRIVIQDKDGKTVFSKDVMLELGAQKLVLDAALSPGLQYRMVTDESTNVAELGFKSPRLVRTFNNTKFPYDVTNVATISSSTFGAVYYYYFYNWELTYDHVDCSSSFTAVQATVLISSHTQDKKREETIFLYPNPVHDILYVQGNTDDGNTIVQILDIHGRHILACFLKSNMVDISSLKEGLYIVTLESKRIKKTFRILKI